MEYRRIYIKALTNGFLVEADDYNYDTIAQVAFTSYDEAVDWIKANPPILKKQDLPTVFAASN